MYTLFLGTLLTDIAYYRTYEIQWTNFSSWALVGALVLGGFALLFSLLGLAPSRRARGSGAYALLLAATWVVGFFNALMHARDAWATMPGSLVLSVITVILGLAATRPSSSRRT